MRFDGIELLGSSTAGNFTISSGSDLPSTGNNLGELFFSTDTGLLYVFDGSSWSSTTTLLTGQPASNITSGVFSTARLGTGTANSTTYLRGDGTWAAVEGGGTPGGSDTQVQFNDGGSFGGNSAFTFNKTTSVLTIPKTSMSTSDANPLDFVSSAAGATRFKLRNSGSQGVILLLQNGASGTANTDGLRIDLDSSGVAYIINGETQRLYLGAGGGQHAYIGSSGGFTLSNGVFTGDGSGLTALNATNLSTGTVGTARLGSGTANSTTFLRGDGTWATVTAGAVSSLQGTGNASVSTSTTGAYAGKDGNGWPVFALVHASAGTDAKYSQLSTTPAGQINFALMNDANTTGVNWMTVARTGTTASTITLTGTNITLTGAVSGTSFSGSGTGLTALNASNLGSGTVPTARLGSGTASSTTYLRGDNTWAAVSAALNSTQVGYGNGSNLLTGSANFTFTTGSNTLELGSDSGRTTTVRARTATSGSTSAGTPDLNLLAGSGLSGVSHNGSVNISAGFATSVNEGYIVFNTGSGSLSERLRINASGAFAIGGSSNYGTAGQILTSAGNAAVPTWSSSFQGAVVANNVNANSLVDQTKIQVVVGNHAGFGFPGMWWVNPAAPADSKLYWTYMDNSGSLIHTVYNGNSQAGAQWLKVDRTGITVTNVTISGTKVTLPSVGNTLSPVTDNSFNLGSGGARWGTVFAATGTINTSDENEKQDIAALSTAEMNVAVALKSMIRKFRFKDAVLAKGNDARIHVGVIAQAVAAAFVAEGLDPEHYGVFCSDTWVDENGDTQTRLGVRYDELFAFIIAAL